MAITTAILATGRYFYSIEGLAKTANGLYFLHTFVTQTAKMFGFHRAEAFMSRREFVGVFTVLTIINGFSCAGRISKFVFGSKPFSKERGLKLVEEIGVELFVIFKKRLPIPYCDVVSDFVLGVSYAARGIYYHAGKKSFNELRKDDLEKLKTEVFQLQIDTEHSQQIQKIHQAMESLEKANQWMVSNKLKIQTTDELKTAKDKSLNPVGFANFVKLTLQYRLIKSEIEELRKILNTGSESSILFDERKGDLEELKLLTAKDTELSKKDRKKTKLDEAMFGKSPGEVRILKMKINEIEFSGITDLEKKSNISQLEYEVLVKILALDIHKTKTKIIDRENNQIDQVRERRNQEIEDEEDVDFTIRKLRRLILIENRSVSSHLDYLKNFEKSPQKKAIKYKELGKLLEVINSIDPIKGIPLKMLHLKEEQNGSILLKPSRLEKLEFEQLKLKKGIIDVFRQLSISKHVEDINFRLMYFERAASSIEVVNTLQNENNKIEMIEKKSLMFSLMIEKVQSMHSLLHQLKLETQSNFPKELIKDLDEKELNQDQIKKILKSMNSKNKENKKSDKLHYGERKKLYRDFSSQEFRHMRIYAIVVDLKGKISSCSEVLQNLLKDEETEIYRPQLVGTPARAAHEVKMVLQSLREAVLQEQETFIDVIHAQIGVLEERSRKAWDKSYTPWLGIAFGVAVIGVRVLKLFRIIESNSKIDLLLDTVLLTHLIIKIGKRIFYKPLRDAGYDSIPFKKL